MFESNRRKALTLVEVIACTVILAIVTIGAVSVSVQISALKASSQNQVYLTLHNLNCMEQLRQMSHDLAPGEELLAFYDSSTFGTSQVDTDVYLEMSTLDAFRVYSVRIDSRAKDFPSHLVSTYVFTSIGGYDSSNDAGEIEGPVLEG